MTKDSLGKGLVIAIVAAVIVSVLFYFLFDITGIWIILLLMGVSPMIIVMLFAIATFISTFIFIYHMSEKTAKYVDRSAEPSGGYSNFQMKDGSKDS